MVQTTPRSKRSGDPDDGEPRDRVDEVLDRWIDEFPERDTRAMGVLLRIARVNRDITRLLANSITTAVPGVDAGTFAVLLLLRISGRPYEQTPTWLADMMQIYPNHLSNLLDRLAANDLIERRRGASDRRRVMVRLTTTGLDAIEVAFDAHYATERQLTAPLTEAEQEELAKLLRKMVLHYEGQIGSGRRGPPSGDGGE